MNTIVWLISFTDRGEKVQKVHTHNCVADYRLIDPAATVREIDCAAVAELVEAATPITSAAHDRGLMADILKGMRPHEAESVRAGIALLAGALANIGGATGETK